MKLLANKHTLLKLHKINEEYNGNIQLKEDSILGQYFKNVSLPIEVVLDKSKLNNQIVILSDNKEPIEIYYDTFVSCLKEL